MDRSYHEEREGQTTEYTDQAADAQRAVIHLRNT
ncbi:hypothetical protein Rifp1Sym_bj00100 [endosymbiont of Riftia pachyptila (vent Ph05)]|uniref:Uncharacterized protein n=1 Tax=endosymbiont of Riftia pachyptila (vent Ph05) TaxID=1048808 RepID=G2DD56_9GAMM|nr:hypothetical protein Rifp1Sym_bj00100 [endosymbiont of Riftia pachyptila (vent Ph05)]